MNNKCQTPNTSDASKNLLYYNSSWLILLLTWHNKHVNLLCQQTQFTDTRKYIHTGIENRFIYDLLRGTKINMCNTKLQRTSDLFAQAYSNFFSGALPFIPSGASAASVEGYASHQGTVQLARLYSRQGALFFRLRSQFDSTRNRSF